MENWNNYVLMIFVFEELTSLTRNANSNKPIDIDDIACERAFFKNRKHLGVCYNRGATYGSENSTLRSMKYANCMAPA